MSKVIADPYSVQTPCPAGCKEEAKSVCVRHIDLDEGCCESIGMQSVSLFLGASNSVSNKIRRMKRTPKQQYVKDIHYLETQKNI
jgi:hypothetical protein